jgi:hypothetical protein
VHSLAVEHMRELDSLVGSERQEQEEVIKIVTGSMYHGESKYSWTKYMGLKTYSQPDQKLCVSRVTRIFLTNFLN